MGVRENIRDAVAALLGVSAFAAAPATAPSFGDEQVDARLKALGGQVSPLPTTRLRWYLHDLESAQYAADTGDLSIAAQITSAALGDGFLRGVLSARMGGVTKLPRTWAGDEEQIAALTQIDGARSVFDDMLPASELAAMATDGLMLGVAVGQLVPVPGRDFPVLVRLEPEFLRFRWSENRWYYASVAGLLPITPGDGRWVLYIEAGRVSPWRYGLWRAIGAAYIDKAHAKLNTSNWEGKLANPARAATAPAGATEVQRLGFLQKLIAWGINTVIELPPGWDVKIIESNGRGWESFKETIARSNEEFMVCVLGQVGTTTSSGAFSSGNVHEQVRADLIAATATSLAHTINTQCLPPWVISRWGVGGLQRAAVLTYDTTSPAELVSRANGLVAIGGALEKGNAALAGDGKRIDAVAEYRRFGVAVVDAAGGPAVAPAVTPAKPAEGAPKLSLVESTVDAEEPPGLSGAAKLAEEMTEHGVPRCEHGSSNRCRLCGVERVRVLIPGKNGTHSWGVAWQPIGGTPEPEDSGDFEAAS